MMKYFSESSSILNSVPYPRLCIGQEKNIYARFRFSIQFGNELTVDSYITRLLSALRESTFRRTYYPLSPADVVSEVGGVSTSVGGRRRLDCFVLGGFWYRVYRCEASIEVAIGGFFSSRL